MHALQIVHENPNFVSYFNNATPVAELGFLNIGSRPSRRKQGGGVETLRAIPWIFAWTQTRMVLPSWLGIGEALQQLLSQACVPSLPHGCTCQHSAYAHAASRSALAPLQHLKACLHWPCAARHFF